MRGVEKRELLINSQHLAELKRNNPDDDTPSSSLGH
jgi:hypothetical protein